MAAPDKAWWQKAGDALVAGKKAVTGAVKKAVATADDVPVPGPKKVSSIPGDIRKGAGLAKEVYRSMRGTKPPLKNRGGTNG
jgi:hypothetical protein